MDEEEEFVSDFNGNIEIGNNSENFCSNCYYLISVLVNDFIDAELVVNLKSVPIPLKDNTRLRDNIED